MKTYLLDTSSFMHRAYHASKERPYYTKDGVPCAAVSLFRTMLDRLYREHSPDVLYAACDVHVPTFRSVLYPEYKAQRKSPPPDFLAQVPAMINLLHAREITIIEVPGYEADDIIGTLAATTPPTVFIVSGDKDMLQLIRPGVYVLNPAKGVFDNARVKAEIGVTPAQIVDLLALRGDTADNVPGAKGVGDKGAVELIQQFGNVEAVIAQSGCISNAGYRRAVQLHADTIRLSKRLVTICCDVPLPPKELLCP